MKKKLRIEEDRRGSMVNYKLGISKGNEHRVIELNIKDLENIDKLTTQFKNEQELKIYLFNQGLITNADADKKLNILYRHGGKVKKLQVAYSPLKQYLDIITLSYILKSMKNDITFLEKLARNYSIASYTYNPQQMNVFDIQRYISDVKSNGGHHFYSRSLDEALDDLYKKATIKKIDKETGEVIFNYRGIRELGGLIYKHKEKERLEKEKEEIEKQQAETKEPSFIPSGTQITFFDIMNSQNEDSHKHTR